MENKKQIIITLEAGTMSMSVINLNQIEIVGLLTHFKKSIHLDMLSKNDDKQINKNKYEKKNNSSVINY